MDERKKEKEKEMPKKKRDVRETQKKAERRASQSSTQLRSAQIARCPSHRSCRLARQAAGTRTFASLRGCRPCPALEERTRYPKPNSKVLDDRPRAGLQGMYGCSGLFPRLVSNPLALGTMKAQVDGAGKRHRVLFFPLRHPLQGAHSFS